MTTAVPTLSEDDLTSLLNRISQKNTVQSLIILDRSSGAIIRSSGSIAAHRDSESLVGEYAGMVWNFVKSAEEMVCGMDEQDDLRLLRIRTKRHELVIVPGKPYVLYSRLVEYGVSDMFQLFADPRFILVVFHDTPPA
ncbi:unnamed protein product [Tuber melanosporum]|uniref:(Perigord truffle) hypothetical protein n=1 Tax=Tuber melanosporum (strain Mel28) TaxID=656061 RepID=D5G7B7_TUBMM|nr:uncharacterized protein GSTUM_00002430001 [Tuber melanosporum]CAZ80410.1 unnamed protein product [Tuber melanosporum]